MGVLTKKLGGLASTRKPLAPKMGVSISVGHPVEIRPMGGRLMRGPPVPVGLYPRDNHSADPTDILI